MAMKKVALAILLTVAVVGCKQNSRNAEINIAQVMADTTVVNVFYFRIKKRCETCTAVAAIAQKTVETTYAGSSKVRYMEIDNSDKANEALLEKYDVAWNALIIAKGDNAVDITQRAFLNAVKNPQLVENRIKNEVNKRLIGN